MKRAAPLIAISLLLTLTTPHSRAEIVEKDKPGYVWFSKCVDEKDLDCIESLGIIDESGKFRPGFPTGLSKPSYNRGSVESKTLGFLDYTWNHKNETWELPGLKTEYNNSYVITEFSLVTGAGQWYDPAANKVYPPSGVNSMRFALLAVPKKEGFEGNMWGVPLQNFEHKCVTQDYANEMICQRVANFSTEQVIQATIRFSWYRASKVQSNLQENSYTVEELGNGATRVTVSGRPINQPYFVDSPTLSRDVYTREKADALSNSWEIKTEDSSDGYTPAACKDKGLPIVTGNMYSQTPPSWNEKTGDLTVNVWAPHLDPSGKPFRGYYEGNFTSEYISCLWGINVSNIANEFSISILDSGEGSNQIVTTSLLQSGNKVRVIASGFHYSREQIKFSRRVSTPNASKTESETKQTFPSRVAKKVTITCTKGKTVKKVVGVKPVCPKGFTKKR